MATNDELRFAQNAIAEALAQHASYSYRASSAVVNKIHGEVDRLSRSLAGDLVGRLDDLTAAELQAFMAGKYTTPRLRAMRDAINAWAADLNAAVIGEWVDPAKQWAGYEAGYVSALMHEVVEGLPSVSVTANQAYRKAMSTPVLGQLVDDMLKGIADDTRGRVYATIRQGISSGQTNAEIIKALRGTKPLNWQDGILQVTKNDVSRIVRTARNHVSNVAYEETYEALGVTHVIVCATLDGKTSKYCASADGKRYRIGDAHPKPPYHPNCRTILAPSLDGDAVGKRPFVRALKVRGGYRINEDGDRVARQASFRSIGDMTKAQRERAGLEVGQVAASTNYGKWFGNQDAAFKREWLGPARYELYSKGEYTLDRFVDPISGKQYTLDQLRTKDAQTFREVFGD